MEGGEQAFVVVIKQLIDLDGNKVSHLSGWVYYYSIKMNIKDRISGCASITSEKFTFNEQDQGKVR